MFSLLRPNNDWLSAMLIYNFCAFALQMPLGLLADKLNRNALVAAAGCIFVASSAVIPAVTSVTPLPLAAAAVMGIGNALFHVGGGIDTLNMSEKKCSPLGLFVSPGALGLCLGTMSAGKLPLYIACLILFIAAAVILLVSKHDFGTMTSENKDLSLPKFSPILVISMLCLFAVVCLRSFAGMSFSFEWKSALPALVTVSFVALGKALGGFTADAVGSKIASILSLSLCAVLFLFSDIAACGLAALLLFNMTMPITLWETAKLFPNAKGFSFGLLTFALFVGFLPVCFGAPALSSILSASAAVLSLVLLLIGIGRKKNVT